MNLSLTRIAQWHKVATAALLGAAVLIAAGYAHTARPIGALVVLAMIGLWGIWERYNWRGHRWSRRIMPPALILAAALALLPGPQATILAYSGAVAALLAWSGFLFSERAAMVASVPDEPSIVRAFTRRMVRLTGVAAAALAIFLLVQPRIAFEVVVGLTLLTVLAASQLIYIVRQRSD